ncbi:hypothetical protein [Parenemella sanctibonifatiensis]|uniref:Uncharacterized protein n=1 Tax=Parenemella sanctibonifatiensis TaxID=2016505 RepID=A0A255EHC0_9ACTN|nr:hypothetical protein [Parenemella sanctibonifatiensis]OYN86620.1 hypothetical protein CGZ92_09850 [Parenemella sanctibonifatiensis]OYN90937.1 hypothetical protein CGZ91_05505 [Parenemella sanctibonifatiensis]
MIWIASIALALIGVTLAVVGVLDVVWGARDAMGWLIAAVTLGYAVFLLITARGLLRLRGWARGPAVAASIIHLAVGASFLGGATVAVGIAVIAVSLLVIVLLVLPQTTAELGLSSPYGPPGQG